MNADLENKLLEKYPRLFADHKKPPAESLMCYGCDHGDGWFFIIDSMCRCIQQHTEKSESQYKFLQVKEKFGGLRVYDTGGDEYTSGIIDMAEAISRRTCEVCGSPGKLNSSGLWVKTLCESHASEMGYARTQKLNPEDREQNDT